MSQQQQHQQQRRLEDSRICSLCGKDQSKDQYSKNQWKKGGTISKCITCIVANNNTNNNNNSSSETNVAFRVGGGDIGQEHNTTANNRSNTKKLTLPSSCNDSFHNNNKNINGQQQQQKQQPTRPTEKLSLSPRPQMNVPGFEEIGLTVCRDWPQTKNGQPPNAQSAIFMPLLACVVGQQLEGYYTEEQLHVAQQWWTQALPSWPRWISALRKVGVDERAREELLRLVTTSESNNNNNSNNNQKKRKRSNPNPLIFKAKCHGMVPHLKGKNQVDLIEMDSMVAIELYACIACMYSQQQTE